MFLLNKPFILSLLQYNGEILSSLSCFPKIDLLPTETRANIIRVRFVETFYT